MKGNTLVIIRNFYPNIGGVETYINEFIKIYVKRKNTRLYIVCPIKGFLPESIKRNKVTMFIPKFNCSFVNLDTERRQILRMIQVIIYYIFILIQSVKVLLHKESNVAYIYGVGGPFSIFPSIILSKVFRKKCFGHIHADFQFKKRLSRLIYRILFNKLDKIFVNSKDVQIDLLEIGVDKRKVVVIDNWVDKQIFKLKDKKTCRQVLNLPENKKILLFVGRLSPEKGINEVLDCIDFFKNDKRFFFVIIGDGPLKNVVEKRIQKNNNVIFLGPKKNFELVNYFNAADLLLWGSIDTHYVSITIMEALHCGLPVIAPITTTQDGKIGVEKYKVRPETLPSEVGVLFEGNVESLINAIDEFFSKKFIREEIKKYALKKYSEDNADLVLSEFR